jgi:hypothetical protein
MSKSTSLSAGDVESLRQEVRELMADVHLGDLLPNELLRLINILGGALVRIATGGVEELGERVNTPGAPVFELHARDGGARVSDAAATIEP